MSYCNIQITYCYFNFLNAIINITGAGSQRYTRVYDTAGEVGYYYDFTDYVDNLLTYSFDNTISSACQTGMSVFLYINQSFSHFNEKLMVLLVEMEQLYQALSVKGNSFSALKIYAKDDPRRASAAYAQKKRKT